ncbi:MAG TPA: sugar phosphate isomerase/epimerase [Verrucomicrobiae bacterium]|jgi:inosose dehydratase
MKLTRRTFLQSAALLAASLPARAAGTKVSLGFSLYGMKSLPLADALKTCAEIGYENVELSLGAGYPTEPKLLSVADRKNLRDLLAKHRLTVSGVMDNMSLAADDAAHAKNLERIAAAAQLAHDLAPEKPPILESVLGGKPDQWDALKDKMAERARDWAKAAASGKLTLCLKPHVNSAVNSPERLLWLHKQTASPFVKLCYDFSHFEVQGMGMEETMKPLIAETRFIHVKDTAGDAKKVQFLLPGEGRTDYAKLAGLLNQHGWSGPVVVEVSAQVFNKPGYDPVAAAKKCYAALAPKFGTGRR